MSDFDKIFIVDCDASGVGVGTVLHQSAELVAFFSHPFDGCHLKLAAYKQEPIGLVQAVRRFLIRTNHYSLKYLLDQHSKLFGFDFTVEY
jgi:hypothetical protein